MGQYSAKQKQQLDKIQMRQFELSLGALNLFHWTIYKKNPDGKPCLLQMQTQKHFVL